MEVLYQEIYKMKAVEARKRVIKTWKETKSIRRTAKLWEHLALWYESGSEGINRTEKKDWKMYPEDRNDLPRELPYLLRKKYSR